MTSTTTEPKETATTTTATMSRVSTMWDQAEKGFLTDAERIAKNMEKENSEYRKRVTSDYLEYDVFRKRFN